MDQTPRRYLQGMGGTTGGRSGRGAWGARWALLVTALALAPALGLFAVFGIPSGVPEAKARAQRNAQLLGSAAQASFDLALLGEAPVFAKAPVERVEAPAEARVTPEVAAPAAATTLLAARAAAAADSHPEAVEAYARHLELAPGDGAAAVEYARLGPESAELGRVLARIPWSATVDGVPARLLAILAAPDQSVDLELLGAQARSLGAGMAGRTIPTGDTAWDQPGGVVLSLDPTLEALHQLLLERCAPTEKLAGEWTAAFRRGPREAMALAQAVAARTDRWTLRPVREGRVVAVRVHPGGGTWVQVAPIRALDSLWAASAGLQDAPDNLRVRAVTEDDPGEPAPAWAAARMPLGDSGLDVLVAHASPEALLSAARWRRAQVAGSLGAAALAIAAAALLALAALGRAERLAAMRSTFVASASHDLRTPVAAIGLLADNLLKGHARGREEEYATQIALETSRVARLVDDLLDFGRMERGLPPKVERERVVLGPWLEEFFGDQREHCRRHGQTFSVELTGLPRVASIDRLAVERALANLIDNGVRHGAGETLRVRGTSDPEGLLRFEVMDSGAGVGAGVHLEDLFEPFARGGSASSGTGLGLSIVRALARAHGGDARLDVRDGGIGLTATLRIDGRERSAA